MSNTIKLVTKFSFTTIPFNDIIWFAAYVFDKPEDGLRSS